jgi:hypothetical protein
MQQFLLPVLRPILLVACAGPLLTQSPFNGVESNFGNRYRLSPARSRRISPENFNGAKGAGGKATTATGPRQARDLDQGWKISPSVVIKVGLTFTIADIEGAGSIQHI